PSNACVLVRLRVDMEDRGGKLELLLPYATLEPVRELLLQQFMGEKFGRDSIWETHLAEELRSTEVSLESSTVPSARMSTPSPCGSASMWRSTGSPIGVSRPSSSR